MPAVKKVVFVVGTTASGKSQWALDLAKEFSGAVVNCDSIQVFQSLDIGAAKPTKAERAEAPHYLYDYVPEGDTMTAGQYCRDFYAELEKIPEENIFVVGGTGFYFQAIEKGMYPVRQTPPEIQKEIARILETPEGAETLYREFENLDPEAAKKIHRQDHYRLGRAMELIRAEGKSLTQIQAEFSSQQNPFPYPLLKIGPQWDREVLRGRVESRTQKMLKEGLVAEVRALVDRGLASWPALQSVGYKEVLEFFRDPHPESWLFEQIVQNTMGLAKKQRTWFQRDKDIHWFPGDGEFAEVRTVVGNFLKS